MKNLTHGSVMSMRREPTVPDFKSDFAIVDVKQGRGNLAQTIKNGGKVLVRVDVLLDTAFADDDGVSQQFSGDVKSIRQLPR